jgi:hypothetical protein
MAKINYLLSDKKNFEYVRDSAIAILIDERNNQKILAAASGAVVSEYDFNVYKERSEPWQLFFDADTGAVSGATPIVNVYFDSMTADAGKSSNQFQSGYTGNINIDCLACSPSELDESTNIMSSGDELTALEVQRVLRLVYNILMAGCYTQLNLKTVVMSRKFSNIQMFQPDINNTAVQRVTGARLVLTVDFYEFSPQYIKIDRVAGVAAPVYTKSLMDEIDVNCTDDAGVTLFLAKFDTTT